MLDTINDLPYTVIVLSRDIYKLMLHAIASSYQRVSNLEYSHIHYDTQENL